MREGAVGDTVLVEIPVSAESAQILEDAAERARAGRLLDDVLKARRLTDDPLIHAIREVKAIVQASGLTDEDIDAELAAHKAERRGRRERGGERGAEG